ncbi:O-antigen ligase family protein [uncultured Intestinimonas sp.]|uniref:O-antigen ligase family protein n=1 Tax=uncultured Intestinimonas sp. TaxID=1689265 RepID=UPI0025D3C70F|nr:O-antigen ligase family protein [uncultured Intestinimonas sp.]
MGSRREARRKGLPQLPKVRVNTPLFFLLAAVLLLFGGYYDFTALLAGAVLALLLLHAILRRGTLPLPRGPALWLLAGMVLCAFLTAPLALSPGMALTGGLRWLAALLFFFYAATYTGAEKELILDSVSWLGAGMAAVSLCVFLVNRLTGVADANGRIDGFFQYANTYALFLMICLLLLLLKEERKKQDYGAMALLVVVIFLSGSRGVFLLLAAAGGGLFLHALAARRRVLPALLGAAAAAALGGLAVLLSGGLVLDRLLAITLESSSLNGRLLYNLDGLRILAAHPLGVGRGGYLYVQPLFQTGPYILRSIHNEYLQAALDGGILSGVLLLALAGWVVLRRGAPLRTRAAAAALALHACIDFDFQFFGMLCLLLLLGSGGAVREVSVPRPALWAAGGLAAAALGFFTLPYTLSFFGNSKGAYALWPADLSLAEERLQHCASLEEAGEIAGRILSATDASMLAWDCAFTLAAQEADYRTMAQCRFQYLRLNPYRPEVYEEMTALLENACEQDPAGLGGYKTLAEQTAGHLEEVYARTSPLAYRIADRPDFSFRPALLIRLEEIEEREYHEVEQKTALGTPDGGDGSDHPAARRSGG